MTNEQNLYDLMARILACASKHEACSSDPAFMRLAEEACAVPTPSDEPEGEWEDGCHSHVPCGCSSTIQNRGGEQRRVTDLCETHRVATAADLAAFTANRPAEPR